MSSQINNDARLRSAALCGLSENHPSKVATQLTHKGFVDSERGRKGGLTLARPAEDVRICDVVRAMKQDSPVVACFGDNKSCLILSACGLPDPLLQAQEAFFATLDRYSLADVTGARCALDALLAV